MTNFGLVLIMALSQVPSAQADVGDVVSCVDGSGGLGIGGPDLAVQWRNLILDQRNPYCAERLLHNDTGLSRLRLDAAHEPELFRTALELTDLLRLMGSPEQCRAIRTGLDARPSCRFCQSADELETWSRRFLPFTYDGNHAANRERLRSCLYDWDRLTPEQRNRLDLIGIAEWKWAGLSFAERRARLMPLADAALRPLFDEARRPRSADELQVLFDLLNRYADDLSLEKLAPAYERLSLLSREVAAQARARAEASGLRSPELRRLARMAATARTARGALDDLSRFFDGARDHDGLQISGAPDEPAFRFDRTTRQIFGSILAREMLAETRGTWAGDGDARRGQEGLISFYSRVPLDVRVENGPLSAIALYHERHFSFNERYLEEYCRSHRQTVRSLLLDPNSRRDLIKLLTPVFVHEARHHQQDDWATTRGLPMTSGITVESEAMQVEAIFVAQKERQQPGYSARIIADPSTDVYTRSYRDDFQALRGGTPAQYRLKIRNEFYAGFPSPESRVYNDFDWNAWVASALQFELDRRRALSAPEKARLETGHLVTFNFRTMRQMQSDLRSASTSSILGALSSMRRSPVELQREYQVWSDRSSRADAIVDAEFAELSGPLVRMFPRARREPPSPGTRRP